VCAVEAWHARATNVFPELMADELAAVHESLYALFVELLPAVRIAHHQGDAESLRHIYGFARWCLDQPGDVSNAAAVAFYEHLFDDWQLREAVTPWLTPRTVREIWTLWEARLDQQQVRALRQLLPSK